MALTPVQNQALCLLAAGYTQEEVARKTGVTKDCICKWKKKPEFEKLLRESVAKVYDAAIAELVSGSIEAARQLKEIITDEDTPKRVKVSAIQVLLTTAARAKESLLEERLEALEASLDGSADQSED
ncbi:hypothetical protein NIES4106_62500 (plasmid) [Fischerella sp. NIES-4106]|nr:hypothetical protein NIES4106_62500 [Fischerella sp. NIES-4106]